MKSKWIKLSDWKKEQKKEQLEKQKQGYWYPKRKRIRSTK